MKKIYALLLAVCLLTGILAGALGEENKIWQKGDSGEEVRRIQARLLELNYSRKEPDGIFDEETEEAVCFFQREHRLLVTGMVDSITRRLLEEEQDPYTEPEYEEWDVAYEDSAVLSTMYPAAGLAAPASNRTAAAPFATAMPFEFNTDEYKYFESNGFLSTASSPLSTFAADVETSAYAQFRRRVLNGEPVPADSIRVEEMLNYFRYDYARPKDGEPFGVTVSCGPCPWNSGTKLLQIGLQAKTVEEENRPPYHLVFLIDTSGSMHGEDRLDLVKRAFLLLLEQLTDRDTVSIVAYASQDRVVLEGVPAGEKTRIMEAICELEAGGSTNGSAGLTRAYEIAEKYRKEGGVSRILLATDGDLNVGVSSEGELARMVSERKKSGIGLTCLGFGMGNYKDNKMEALADYGDGNCWYIDTIYEARRALVTEAGGTFLTVAKDVKLQVDFNPAFIRGYRLIGYEDRLMAAEDFANDEKDGGELGSGHRVTALYEIVPTGSAFDFGGTESRYAQADGMPENGEMLTVAVRVKEPEGTESRLYEYPVSSELLNGEMDDNMKFAAAVAETAMLLRNSEWKGEAGWDQALELLRSCGTVSGDTYKEEFLYLVTLLQRSAAD